MTPTPKRATKPARPDVDNVFLSLDGYPHTVNAITQIMKLLTKNSSIPRFHAHLLRHTCGVQYLMVGGDTKSLQMFLRYVLPFMTHHYEQFKDEQVTAQHRKYSSIDGLGVVPQRFWKNKQVVPKPKPRRTWQPDRRVMYDFREGIVLAGLSTMTFHCL